MNKQIIINVVKYDVRDKLESDNIRFRCHIMHNPCKAKKFDSGFHFYPESGYYRIMSPFPDSLADYIEKGGFAELM